MGQYPSLYIWTCPFPQTSEIGELDACIRLTTVRRLCGQDSMGPSGVLDQSWALMTLAISPPPTNQSLGESAADAKGEPVPGTCAVETAASCRPRPRSSPPIWLSRFLASEYRIVRPAPSARLRFTDDPSVLTVDELAALLRVNRKTVYDALARAQLQDDEQRPVGLGQAPQGGGEVEGARPDALHDRAAPASLGRARAQASRPSRCSTGYKVTAT